MKRFYLLILLVLVGLVTPEVKGQNYEWAIGLRASGAPGLSVKKFINPTVAAEGQLTGRWNGLNVTGLAEFNFQIPQAPGLDWFWGIGANMGNWNHPGPFEGQDFYAGIDAIVGMEYTFADIPLNLALDWKPYYLFINVSEFIGDEFALSVRITIQ